MYDKLKKIGRSSYLLQGREKGNVELNKPLILKDFDFMTNNAGKEYSVFILENYDLFFYFGGVAVTDKLKQIKDCLSTEELKEVLNKGLHCKFISKKSTSNRIYIDLVILL